MSTDKQYEEKELSWLSFNERVLQEAMDKTVPLIERVRFLGIFSSNQDEFFKVRVSDVKRRILINEVHGGDDEAKVLLRAIQQKVMALGEAFDNTYKELLIALARHNIFLVNEYQLSESIQQWLRVFFKEKVLRHIIPILLNKEVNPVKFLKDEYTYLAIEMKKNGQVIQYALVEVPTDDLPRFFQLPPEGTRRKKQIIILDNVIRFCLDEIFKGFFDYDEIAAYAVKLTRDAEYDLSDQLDLSLVDKMSDGLKQRLTAMPVRFVYEREMPAAMISFLKLKLQISSYDAIMPGGRYHNFKDFIGFPNVGRDYLENPKLPALDCRDFDGFVNAFDAITKQDILLYYPYHKFHHFTELVRQAAFDPAVSAIRINIYRVAKKSRIIHSLIDAANNGKKVTVVVELRARFDEAANIDWANILTDAGVKVVFGVPSLKIHSKLCLITRHEQGEAVRYAHIGTGNFNEKTAKIYTDFSLLTRHPDITAEVEGVFEYIEYPYRRYKFNHLLVSPINSRRQLYRLIDNELANAKAGQPSGITLKINNLVDRDLINRLYAAGQAGVPIQMIIRGMCALRPGVPGLSENIRVISIIDRFLEHPRVMVFHNKGNPQLYISSADWMSRNIDGRIEVGTPIYDERLKQRILDILELQLSDTCKARVIDADQQNEYVKRGNRRKIRSQVAIYDYLKRIESNNGQ
ncbi:polyphosphate kinase 1 [Aeromonas hydrophila]|uniref:Polyphosphate kinase n=1 Tax=Aeromonas hydrophila subsp. hydrophila (strain ATCC 7966 / DSM 30187 / BCRC 13018 / CCUG 14551 / JCM 1027 / KCTC 2358 / NCIMB 9240 / NCTC 8049) TaxID=380703 RepID=A0KM32_AERHH|nr:polyphosphate kinase 1 [Aeromonas hydrophila]ABK36538.1 polyphosphate kinase [Aeromonas hydrophila subsp. hydrophila ATCC 7966]MBS4672251.1 polyphosphate kinase 1 [Aeromonas hydrophila]OOD36134.1 RNA degradosome polyphosphate kinase [Aeromonas hydrophila]SUU29899.1 polyphosphate kinase [Aeromonas hydrophila]